MAESVGIFLEDKISRFKERAIDVTLIRFQFSQYIIPLKCDYETLLTNNKYYFGNT